MRAVRARDRGDQQYLDVRASTSGGAEFADPDGDGIGTPEDNRPRSRSPLSLSGHDGRSRQPDDVELRQQCVALATPAQ
jgi:hypothetical protein